jgi:hypothetical protein
MSVLVLKLQSNFDFRARPWPGFVADQRSRAKDLIKLICPTRLQALFADYVQA